MGVPPSEICPLGLQLLLVFSQLVTDFGLEGADLAGDVVGRRCDFMDTVYAD